MHATGRLQARGPAEEKATAHWAPPPLYSVPWQEMRFDPARSRPQEAAI
jgi:hypothetical protein